MTTQKKNNTKEIFPQKLNEPPIFSYKMRMFGVPIDGPSHMYFNNESVYKNELITESRTG